MAESYQEWDKRIGVLEITVGRFAQVEENVHAILDEQQKVRHELTLVQDSTQTLDEILAFTKKVAQVFRWGWKMGGVALVTALFKWIGVL